MDRLTERVQRATRDVVVYIGSQRDHEDADISAEVTPGGVREILHRLAAYEDTGLEPEQVIACTHALMGQEIATITEFEGIPIKRMIELARAEKDGRLVVLPTEDYTFKIRGDIAIGLIKANCRAARLEAEAALEEEHDD